MPNRAIKNKTRRTSSKSAQRNTSDPKAPGPNLYDGRANPKAGSERVSPTPPSGSGQKIIDWDK